MNLKQYQELESILISWWDSLPEEMKKELNKFYETKKEVSDTKWTQNDDD